MKNIKNLLDYWYQIEFFSPFWPEKTKDTFNSTNQLKPLPWENSTLGNFEYNVYIGKVKSQDMVYKVLNLLHIKSDSVEPDNSNCCICSLVLSSDGRYQSGHFCLSTFIWSICEILNKKELNVSLDIEDMKSLVSEIESKLGDFTAPITYSDIQTILDIALDNLTSDKESIQFSVVVNRKYTHENTREDTDEDSPAAKISSPSTSGNMLSSFYINDIDIIRNSIRQQDRLVAYINALSSNTENRIEIDHDIEQMQKYLSPGNYPLGKWPSKFSPSLMQQLSVNLALDQNKTDSNIFSVNGPPGTGKTTLLKEIIASNIVERAILLSDYPHPDDAFQKQNLKQPPNSFLKSYYKPGESLIPFGMLVASNNNAAVENISKELPLTSNTVSSKCNTDLFDNQCNEENYFSEIASHIIGESTEKCWGLISAHLGNRKNIYHFKQNIWFSSKHETLRSIYYSPNRDAIPNWENAKKRFKKKYSEIISYRSLIDKDIDDLRDMHKMEQYTNYTKEKIAALDLLLTELSSESEKLNAELVQTQTTQTQISEMCSQMEQSKSIIYESIALLRKQLPFWVRCFPFLFSNNKLLLQIRAHEQELYTINCSISDKRKDVNTTSQEHIELQNKLDTAQKQFQQLEADKKSKLKDLVGYRDSYEKIHSYLSVKYNNNFANNEFWTNIQYNKQSQAACPWTTKEYDTLREELFFEALMLQKAFILNSNAVKQNMNCLVNLWNNEISYEDFPNCHADLMNTLFLVVPVVSTTFASIAQFLNGIGQNQLGTLIIDEAGQATPQSALGAIWRSQKTIVVGDPLQVEPIITTPKELCKKFADEFHIESCYRPLDISVQMLADQVNPFGAYRNCMGVQFWVGCPLIVHRRCIDPMFSISNEIAYDNRMLQETRLPDSSHLLHIKQSIWFDIKGTEIGLKNHYVPEQGGKVLELILNAFLSANGFPDLYIISPFKSVSTSIIEILNEKLPIHLEYLHLPKGEINKWIKQSCGTIHTFQGKEANEVILVLGCDSTNGYSAAQWAGRKPNILNVAATRAKYRLAVIGDSNLWRNVPYFDVAYNLLASAGNGVS